MSKQNLLHCPFCGNPNPLKGSWIECEGCGAYGPDTAFRGTIEDGWNSRPSGDFNAFLQVIERYSWAISPVFGGGFEIEISVPTGAGDFDVQVIGRGKTLIEALGRAVITQCLESEMRVAELKAEDEGSK